MQSSIKSQMLALNGAIFVSMLGFGIIVPILPIYAKQMGASSFMLGIMVGVFSLSRALVVPWVGMLSDRFGRKKFLLTGLIGFAILALLMNWAQTPLDLGFNRFGQGVFSAMLLPVAMAMVADLAPIGFEGRAFAGFNTSFLLGLGLGPFVGGLIYDTVGITANFIFMSSVCLVSFAVVLFKIAPSPPVEQERAGGFWRDLRLLQDRTMQGLFWNRVATNLGSGLFLAFLPVLGVSQGLSNVEVGILFGVNTMVMTLIQKPSSWLADTRFRLHLTLGGSVLIGLCRIALPWAGEFYLFLLIIIVDGIAAGIVMPAANALGISAGHRMQAGMGAVMGFFTLAVSLGFFFGPILGGFLADHTSLAVCFYILGGVVVLGALTPLALRTPADVDTGLIIKESEPAPAEQREQ